MAIKELELCSAWAITRFPYCFTAEYVCTYRKPQSPGTAGDSSIVGGFSGLVSLCFVTYTEGKRFSNTSNTDSCVLLGCNISYSTPILIKFINYENPRHTDFCILKKSVPLPGTARPSPAESLALIDPCYREMPNIFTERSAPLS